MRHIEIRDLCLQKEAREGKLLVSKVPGGENPADLMTKILTKKEICERLGKMNITVVLSDACVGSVQLGDKHSRANEVLNFKCGRGSVRDGSDHNGGSIQYLSKAVAKLVNLCEQGNRR